jgi:hypothetical protein
MLSPKIIRYVAAGTAAAVVAVGAFAIGNASSSNSSSSNGASGTANSAQGFGPRQGGAQAPDGPPAQAASGQIPQGWQQGDGTLITGAAADKVEALALANYPGTVNRVLKLSDGSYVAHIFANPAGPHHVFVSKDFKITGTV